MTLADKKLVSASQVTLSQLMQPEHANLLGNVHGGWIMKLVDEVGALARMRHANQRVVTVAVDQLTFQHPVKVGDLVTLTAEVSYVGRTSMEAEVKVIAENPVTGQQWHTNTAYLVYVALGKDGKPIPVPALEAEDEEHQKRMEQGKARQAYRLAQKRQNHTES